MVRGTWGFERMNEIELNLGAHKCLLLRTLVYGGPSLADLKNIFQLDMYTLDNLVSTWKYTVYLLAYIYFSQCTRYIVKT